MTESEIIRRLNITGTPKVTELQSGYTYKNFPKQSDLIREVQFDTSGGELRGLWLKYATPVPVSMGRLKGLLGEPEPQGMVVGKNITGIGIATSAASNVPYGHRPPEQPPQTSFRYRHAPSRPTGVGYKSEVTVDTDGMGENVKGMESLRLYRYKDD